MNDIASVMKNSILRRLFPFLSKENRELSSRDPNELYREAMIAVEEKNLKKAFRLFKGAALQGHADAQYKLSYIYHNGKGTRVNRKKAFAWMAKAAEQGNPSAQYHTALYYGYGIGVKRDITEAVRWFELAADQGHHLNALQNYTLFPV